MHRRFDSRRACVQGVDAPVGEVACEYGPS